MTPVRVADGRQVKTLTRDDAISALREYAELHGEPVTSAAFNPSTARWRGREDLVTVYYAGRGDGRAWPSLNAIKGLFDGSFSDALRAAGLSVAKPGPVRHRAAPILDRKIQRVLVESSRDRELSNRIDVLERQLDRARVRAERAELLLVELRERGAPIVRERAVRDRPVGKPKIVEKRIKVRDRKAEDRLRSKLADAEARAVALADQNVSMSRELGDLKRSGVTSRFEAEQTRSEVNDALSEIERLTDALSAAEGRVSRLRSELEDVQMIEVDARERAVASDLVARAEQRADQAERRAAKAERQMAEQAAAITGEQRKLTMSEMRELKTKGPAGPSVLGDAISKLAVARRSGNKLDESLIEVARAALTWRDRLR